MFPSHLVQNGLHVQALVIVAKSVSTENDFPHHKLHVHNIMYNTLLQDLLMLHNYMSTSKRTCILPQLCTPKSKAPGLLAYQIAGKSTVQTHAGKPDPTWHANSYKHSNINRQKITVTIKCQNKSMIPLHESSFYMELNISEQTITNIQDYHRLAEGQSSGLPKAR